jgi:hypothetical protein
MRPKCRVILDKSDNAAKSVVVGAWSIVGRLTVLLVCFALVAVSPCPVPNQVEHDVLDQCRVNPASRAVCVTHSFIQGVGNEILHRFGRCGMNAVSCIGLWERSRGPRVVRATLLLVSLIFFILHARQQR